MHCGSAAYCSQLLALSPSSSCFGCVEAYGRKPELSLQVLSGLGGVRGSLFAAGWTVALIGSVLFAALT
jgi:hypothetical protein